MAKIAPYIIIVNLLFLYSLHAQADWGINGIAAECSESGDFFELSPIVELSSPAAGEVKLKQGFRDGLKKSFLEKYSPATMRVTGRRFR